MVLLRRAPALVVDAPSLDDEQQAALDARGPLLRVLGAPGTGKTTTAVELVVDRVLFGGLSPDECLLLTSTRVAAARLRERVTARLARTSTEPLARTHQAFGFGILRREAALRGDEPPRLISGPEQDVILRELLTGHAKGDATPPPWPEHVLVALDKRGFRAELRDLLMRAVEHGVEADRLAALGAEHGRPEWVAAAQVLREYDEVTAFSRPGRLRPGLDPHRRGRPARGRLRGAGEGMRGRAARRRRRRPGAHLAAARLLRVLTSAGPDLVLVGDPDVAVQTFRGADPRILASGWTDLGRPDPTAGEPPTVVLHTAYRQPSALLGVSRTHHHPHRRARRREAAGARAATRRRQCRGRPPAVAGPGGGAHRGAAARGSPPRRRRLGRHGRHRPQRGPRRGTAAHPHGPRRADAALGEREPGPRRGGRASAAGPRRHRARRWRWTPTTGSSRSGRSTSCCRRWGSATRSGLRRLRRLLRREELDSGGERSSDELLAAVLLEPGHAASLGHDAAPLRRLVARDRRGARRGAHGLEPTARPGTPTAAARGLPVSARRRCSGRCGTPSTSAAAGTGSPCAAGSVALAPTATSTRSSGCSTRRSVTSTGSRPPGRTRSSSTSRARTSPATPSRRGRSRATASPW